ncbi:MAG: DUF1641 domain-containing protein [Caldilineaceae bacterium]|nr:DUF1641 domain-containing protein [Caldilineaceae bacterium]
MSAPLVEVSDSVASNGTGLDEISRKLDTLSQNVTALGEQVRILTDKAYDDRRRRQEWDEFRADVSPVITDMYAMTVEQLEEIQAYVQLEDVLALMKRFARNTRTFNDMLDQVESMYDLWKDVSPLSREMVDEAVIQLSMLEQKGYFGFAKEGAYVLDQVVTSFSQEDVRLLGDNVVTILNTVKSLTQPEVMSLIDNLTTGFQQAEENADELPTSMFGLLREMRDPEVRRGLAITLSMLKTISRQY